MEENKILLKQINVKTRVGVLINTMTLLQYVIEKTKDPKNTPEPAIEQLEMLEALQKMLMYDFCNSPDLTPEELQSALETTKNNIEEINMLHKMKNQKPKYEA